jgi:hypothetical protein
MVALPSTITSFAWPDHAAHLTAGITNLAQLRLPTAAGRT